MATRYWEGDDGASPTSWTTAANWGGVAPVGGDTMVIDGRESNDPTTDMEAANSLANGMLLIKKNHSGTVGAAGAGLHLGATTIIIQGSGTYYIEISELDAVSDETTARVVVDNKDATVYLSGEVNTASWCCEITQLTVLAGTVHIGHNGSANADVAVATLDIAPKNNKASNVTVTMYPDCRRTKATSYATDVYMSEGTFTCDSEIDALVMMGGTLNYGTDLAGSPEADLDIATMKMTGGAFNWYPDDSGDPTIGLLYLYGGTFDASGTTNNDRDKVIGSGANDCWVFEGATLNIANGKGNITFGSSLLNFGGDIIVDNMTGVGVTYNQTP